MVRILLVDDDGLVGSLLEDVLQIHGYEVRRALDTATAWELFCSDRPDVVVTDSRFKGSRTVDETGLGLAHRLKAAFPETPVVLISSDPPPEAHSICDAVFTKPLPIGVLREFLSQLGLPSGPPRLAPVSG